MRIVDHRLRATGSQFRVVQAATPNMGAALAARFVVIHYTAGTTAAGAIGWMCDPASKVSAHLVIDRTNGAVTQLVPFDRIAWHAGRSSWNDIDDLNRCAIGIELDNAGKLERDDGGWRSAAGAIIPEADVVVATHAAEAEPAGWHRFTAVQLAALDAVVLALHAAYPIEAVLGHDEIAPNRKLDPGPAFPMAALRARVAAGGAPTRPSMIERMRALFRR